MALILGVLAPAPVVAADGAEGLIPAVVFLRSSGDKDVTIGSGFLVKPDDESRLFMVTAEHVAKKMGESGWWMYLHSGEHPPARAEVVKANWKFSDNSDVAVYDFPLKEFNENQRKRLLAQAAPERMLSSRPLPPDRETPLTAMGFPNALGAIDFSDKSLGPSSALLPLIIETKAACGIMVLPRLDTKKPASFIILQAPSIGGMSGGPVWDTGKSYMTSDRRMVGRSGTSIVGLMHGTLGDNTGGKLAMVVPATAIKELLDEILSEK
jgi:hypothetical protein